MEGSFKKEEKKKNKSGPGVSPVPPKYTLKEIIGHATLLG
jgi:hypothetical protein